jgi:DNA-binding NarL/FixJ family response regulator
VLPSLEIECGSDPLFLQESPAGGGARIPQIGEIGEVRTPGCARLRRRRWLMLSVLLVDDHAALRQGLEVLLERKGIDVLASTGSVADALVALRGCEPDVVVVDLELPDQSGAGLVRQLRQERFDGKALIYTGSQDAQTLGDALETGAEGVVLKPGGLGSLVEALRAVGRGERWLDPEIAKITKLAESSDQLLTKRERQMLALLADGLSGEEIAERLTLSAETVRTHVRNAMGKLAARTRTEAVVKALETGEIRPEGADPGSVDSPAPGGSE